MRLKDRGEELNRKSVLSFLGFCVIMFAFFHWVLIPCEVRECSMEPTFHEGDRIFVNGLNKSPKDGEVFIFRENGVYLIKRCIATEGEHLVIKDGKVKVNGRVVNLKIKEDDHTEGDIDTVIKKGEIFAMGDNRDFSLDSRSFGAVKKSQVKGTHLMRFWKGD